MNHRSIGLTSGFVLGLALALTGVSAYALKIDVPETDAMRPQIATSTTGCGRLAAHVGLINLSTTDGLGRARTFMIEIPANYNPTKPYSLNFVFHGAGGNGAQAYSWGLQNTSGASTNGIFVYPNGVPFQNYGVGWDDRTHGYDMPFFDNMVRQVEHGYCVNSARVFVAGFSWGGDFVTALTCIRGNVIRAAAVNSASDEFSDDRNYLTYQNLPCPTSTHPPVRFEHAAGGDSAYPAPKFGTTSKLFQRFNSCGTSTTPVRSSSSAVSCVAYNSCSKEFVDCAFNASIGHTLPPNWAADTWAFFQTFP